MRKIADGNIKIAIEVDGKQIGVVTKDLKNLESAGTNVGKTANTATGSIKKFAAALGLVAIGAAAFKVLSASMGDAISRFDTLNKFPKVLQSLGVSAEDSEKAMSKLSDGIDGLPTKLDEIASTAQRMYTSFGDMDKAADSALALNNALLSSGSSAGQASRGTEQYLKVLQTGKMDMVTWKTLSETMDVGLVKIAEGFGYAGQSAKSNLYSALKEGTITVDQFNDKLIELGTGTGELAELARTNSAGIATSLENLKTAAARGIADILDSLNRLSKDATGKELAEHINGLKVIINTSFKVMGRVIEGMVPVVKGFTTVLGAMVSIIRTLSPVLAGLFAVYASHAVITKAKTAVEASNKVLLAAQASTKGLTIATNAQTIAEVQAAATKKVLNAAKEKGEVLSKAEIASRAKELIATNTQTVATAAQTGAVKLSTLVIGVFTGTITAKTAAETISAAASYALGTAIKFLMGPVGWVTLGIGALVTAVFAFIKCFKRGTEETKRLNEATDELKTSTNELNTSITRSKEANARNIYTIKETASANRNLAEEVSNLMDKENKSADEKKLLKSKIVQLNEAVSDLNLSYDEQANALNMSSKELRNRVDLIEQESSFLAAQERLAEIESQRAEIGLQQGEINDLKAEWNQQVEEGTVKSGKAEKAIAKLEEQEKLLKETEAGLAEQHEKTKEQMVAAAQIVADETGKSINSILFDYDQLDEAQQTVFNSMVERYEDLVDVTSNVFDRIGEKSKVSGAEMIANLQHNQEITAKWGENQAKLMEYAGKDGNEGFLRWLDTMGPESAAELAEVANMSKPELDKFIALLNDAPVVATDSFKTSLGEGLDEAVMIMSEKANGMSVTFRQQMEDAGFDDIGGMVGSGFSSGVEKSTPKAEKAAKSLGDKSTKATKSSLGISSPSKVYQGIGKDIVDGLVLGISQGESRVITAIQKMFRQVENTSKISFSNITRSYDQAINTIDRSLSKLPRVTQTAMTGMTNAINKGSSNQVNSMKGLSQGYDTEIRRVETSLNKLSKIIQTAMNAALAQLKSGASQQVSEMKKLSNDIRTPFKSINSQFNSIGRSAMSGLNSGLWAGRSQVMSTARSIANSVASVMRSALKVGSPSKIMRDDVGRWIPEGVAVGIESHADSVYKELDKMVEGMMRITSPEMALGTSKMAYSGSVHGSPEMAVIDAVRGDIQNDNRTTITGNTFVIRHENDIERVAEELDRLRKRKLRGVGVPAV